MVVTAVKKDCVATVGEVLSALIKFFLSLPSVGGWMPFYFVTPLLDKEHYWLVLACGSTKGAAQKGK